MLSRTEIIRVLKASGRTQATFFAEARRLRADRWGKRIIRRGVVEISNVCRQDCAYCAMRRSNADPLPRYLMSATQIMRAVGAIRRAGIDVVFLQGGESVDAARRAAEVIPQIRALFHDKVEIVLSLGVLPASQYERMKEAGADSFILKHETADPELHARMRGQQVQKRVDSLTRLKALGYHIGTGVIVGLPGQELESIADDILLAAELGVEMSSASPFIPAKGTPTEEAPPGSAATVLNTIAAMRLMNPAWLIPAVSALNILADDGQSAGLMAGANVVTANFTPATFRRRYPIYGAGRQIADIDRVSATLARLGLHPMGYC